MREDITWRQTFMKILLNYYYKDNIKEPQEVIIKTKEYQSNNDPNQKFVETYLEKKSGDGINWIKLWEYYQIWYQEENGNNFIKKSVVKKYFEDRVFKSKSIPVSKEIGRGWCGWRIKEELFKEF
jgi:phage/plasmid-associated DNA primase